MDGKPTVFNDFFTSIACSFSWFLCFSESATATGFSLSGLSISLCLEALSKSQWFNWSSSYYDTVMLG